MSPPLAAPSLLPEERLPAPAAGLGPTRMLRRVFGLALVWLAIKAYLAGALWPFRDEAYYWQCSRNLALGYSDLPAGHALLIRLGRLLAGETVLGLRMVPLLLGSLVPLAVLAWARPLVGEEDAAAACGWALLLPAGAGLGILAVPDVLLVLATLGLAIALESATRPEAGGSWIPVGAAGAVGFSSHYRFLFAVAGATLYMLMTRRGRSLIATPGPWVALAVSSLGVVPTLIHNLELAGAPALVQLWDRHPWSFDPVGLNHPLKQAVVVTPLLYLVILAAMLRLLRQAWRGDDRAQLGSWLGAFPLLLFGGLSPFTDHHAADFHWTLSSHLLLLPWVPATLRAAGRLRGGAMLGPLTGICAGAATAGWMGYLVVVTQLEVLGPRLEPGWMSTSMAGWGPVQRCLRARLAEGLAAGRERVVLVDQEAQAAIIDFLLGGQTRVYNLQQGNRYDRRAPGHPRVDPQGPQYRRWERDAQGLSHEVGHDALLVVVEEKGYPYSPVAISALRRVAAIATGIELLDRLVLLGGAKQAGIYLCRGLRAPGGAPIPPARVPYPPFHRLDRLGPGAAIDAPIDVSGWAECEGRGVEGVDLLLDGMLLGAARYGLPRPDVQAAFPSGTDPGRPLVGFTIGLDPGAFPPGTHRLGLEIRCHGGIHERTPSFNVVLPPRPIQEASR